MRGNTWRNHQPDEQIPPRVVIKETKYPPMSASSSRESPEKFVPRGAIAFFALLIFIGLVIWFGIYFVMLARS